MIKTDLTLSVNKQCWRVLLMRGLWTFLIWPLFKYLPQRLSFVRVFVLRLFRAKIGPKCLICSGVGVLMPWNLVLANHVAIGKNVEIYNFSEIFIGAMSVVSQNVYLCTGSHDYTHPNFPLIHQPIAVGSECWLAANSFLGPGIRIGDGAVIGACSVVTKDMPAWMVCAGNPCKPIKPRKLDCSVPIKAG